MDPKLLARPGFARLALVLFLGGMAPQAAAASEFTIRKLTPASGGKLHLYHDHIAAPADAEVRVTVGGRPCKPVPSQALLPGRGGDKLAVLLVLDRGGTPTSGMGQYSDALKSGVTAFAMELLARKTGDKIAIIDSAGRAETPRQLKPTVDDAAVLAFMAQLPAPAGSGADVYGTANLGLALLDGDTQLRAVVLVSDGVDPADPKGESASPQTLIDEAGRRGIPVATVVVDRAGEAGRGKEAQLRGQTGRATLIKVANHTAAEYRSVPADANLAQSLQATLKGLAELYAQVERTSCTLCGSLGGSGGLAVDMVLTKAGAEVAHSRSEPPVRLTIPATEFGPCAAAVDSPIGGGAATPPAKCDPGKPCSACESCTNGTCAAKPCKLEADCDATCTCENGACRRRAQLRDYAPWAIGAVAALGVLLVVLARRRRAQQDAARAAAVADEARRTEQNAASDREAALRAEAERERQHRIEAEAEAARKSAEVAAAIGNLAQEGERLARQAAARANPILYHLVSAVDSSVVARFELRAGTWILGAAEPAQLRLAEPLVSSRHAEVKVEPSGKIWLTDLGSSNGTFLNRQALPARSPVELRIGDEIAISKRVLLHLIGGDGSATLVADARPQAAPSGGTQLEE